MYSAEEFLQFLADANLASFGTATNPRILGQSGKEKAFGNNGVNREWNQNFQRVTILGSASFGYWLSSQE